MTKLETLKQQTADLEAKLKEMKAEIDQLENGWEMEGLYVYGDKYFMLESSGRVGLCSWDGLEVEERMFNQGNIFSTKEEAELEAKRRSLLTRFRAFRDECNGDWKINWDDVNQDKYIIKRAKEGYFLVVKYWTANEFNLFGYFKKYKDAKRAVELFGDEIKELFVEGDA